MLSIVFLHPTSQLGQNHKFDREKMLSAPLTMTILGCPFVILLLLLISGGCIIKKLLCVLLCFSWPRLQYVFVSSAEAGCVSVLLCYAMWEEEGGCSSRDVCSQTSGRHSSDAAANQTNTPTLLLLAATMLPFSRKQFHPRRNWIGSLVFSDHISIKMMVYANPDHG